MFHKITQSQSPVHSFNKGRFQKALNFKVGETFKGTVIQRLPNREVLVGAMGRQFRAHTSQTLQEGRQYHFQVKSSGSKVELKVLEGEVNSQRFSPPDGASARETGTRLAKILMEISTARVPRAFPAEAKEALGSLTRLLPALVYNGTEKDAGKWLMQTIPVSGLFWESKVARYLMGDRQQPWKRMQAGDLKGLLLSLEKTLAEREDLDGQIKALAQKIREALHVIEHDQFLNLAALREETGWFLFLPGLRDDGFAGAEIFVEKNNEEENCRFYMVMEFTQLGHIEATITIARGAVDVMMLLGDEEKAAYVSEQLTQLEKALEKAGLRPGTIVCGVGGKEDGEQMSFPENVRTAKPVHMII